MVKTLTKDGLMENINGENIIVEEIDLPLKIIPKKYDLIEQNNKPITNPLYLMERRDYYTRVIFLSLFFLAFVTGIIWLGYSFHRFSEKDFSTNVPVTNNVEPAKVDVPIENNYQHNIDNLINITIEMPDTIELKIPEGYIITNGS